jgi:glycosyltransferase involved in cell wall biosynthesis
MKFSVVIPALNEAKQIQRTIKFVSEQSISRKDYEIVVVDSKSTDATAKLAREAGADIVISEKLKGTNFARQRGVEVSHGEIVAFLDADCHPGKDWLARIEYNLRHPGVAAVSGPYDYGFTGLNKFFAHIFNNILFPLLPDVLYLLFGRKDSKSKLPR